MPRGRPTILIDARVNAMEGAHGIARSVMKLTAHLARDDDDLTVRVLANTGRPQIFPLADLPPRAHVVETDIGPGAVHRCLELARLIRSTGAGVMYIPYPTFTPLIRPCPVVVTLHDCTIERDVRFAGSWHRQAQLTVATRAAVRRAAAVTAPSEASLADIRRHYPSAPNPALVPNGVDLTQFSAVPADSVAVARQRYALPDQFILAIGAHRPHKNHEVLVRALAELPAHMSVVIVGYVDPSFQQPLPGLIARLGLESRVRLVPGVADSLLPAVYRAASVFAFPSLAEGFGMPVLEAMASGIPVVASDIPPVAEVTGSAATLVSPTDVAAWASAVTAMLADPALARRRCEAGAAIARSLSWERGAAALRSVLMAVATGRAHDYEVSLPSYKAVNSSSASDAFAARPSAWPRPRW
ncbi:MAG TPA: glycosyltransferase family 1 protein [Streptosporangiaceae bacterium]|nr:glycosyltransferase family 1 protein [Streptosporangiaceae bacterium]